jgi:hypothetical protein
MAAEKAHTPTYSNLNSLYMPSYLFFAFSYFLPVIAEKIKGMLQR